MKLYINCTAEEATHIAKDRDTTEKLFIKPYELPTEEKILEILEEEVYACEDGCGGAYTEGRKDAAKAIFNLLKEE